MRRRHSLGARFTGASCGALTMAWSLASSKAVLFELSPQAELSRIVIPQEGGIEIEFSFAGWRWNPPVEKSLFEFNPPRGVAIVDGLLPDTPGLRQ